MARGKNHQNQVPGLSLKVRTWRQKWYYLPDDERAALRRRYHNNKDAYFAAFCPDEADQETMLELGMTAFVKLEAQLLRRFQFDAYEKRGQLACLNLIQNMVQDSSGTDLVFVAIDFEGNTNRNGVTELGLARFDIQHLEKGIQGSDISTSSHHKRRKYLFGNYMRIDIAQLPTAIVENLCGDSRIILVGHSIKSELFTLEQLGVPIEDLPNVIGVIDTEHLGRAEFGARSLQGLMDAAHIPYEPNTFHCGGNDAHYTMQVFLAFLVRRENHTGGLSDRICDRLRELAWAKAPLKREVRQQINGDMEEGDSEGFCGVGDLFDEVEQ